MIKRGEETVNIKNIREKAGVTQIELAKALNIGQSAVAAWETGQALPRADKLIQIAEVLHCTVDDLLRGEENAKE